MNEIKKAKIAITGKSKCINIQPIVKTGAMNIPAITNMINQISILYNYFTKIQKKFKEDKFCGRFIYNIVSQNGGEGFVKQYSHLRRPRDMDDEYDDKKKAVPKKIRP